MTKATKMEKRKQGHKKVKEFSLSERVLITATSIVAFGGFVFCAIMIVLMNSIEY